MQFVPGMMQLVPLARRRGHIIPACIVLLSMTAPAAAQERGASNRNAAAAATGLVCQVSENGQPASGVATLLRDGQQVASGACDGVVKAEPGDYQLVVRLDGALDRPERQQTLQLTTSQPTPVRIDFPTALLSVQVEADGKRAAAMLTVLRNGQSIGTVGAGVPVRLSAGSYQLLVRHRDKSQHVEVEGLRGGEKRTVQVTF